MMPRTLKLKVALSVAVGLAVVLGLYSTFVVRQQRQDLLDAAVHHVLQLSDAIVRSTHFMMLQNQASSVHRIIVDVGRSKNIDRIRIFSKKGVVIDSTLATEVGLALDSKAEGCVSCHATDRPLASVGDSDRVRFFAMPDGRRMVGTMQVIRNEPDCQTGSCHAGAAKQSTLGVLDVVYSLAEVDQKIRASAIRIAELSLGFALLAAACVGLLVHRLVYTPLLDLEAGAKRLAAGNLDEPIPVRSDDEFGQVAASFNVMTTALREIRVGAARVGAQPGAEGGGAHRSSCAPPRPRPTSAKSSRRSACSPPASRTSSTIR